MKEYIKKGFGLYIGALLGFLTGEAVYTILKKTTNKERPKTEKEPESGDSQE